MKKIIYLTSFCLIGIIIHSCGEQKNFDNPLFIVQIEEGEKYKVVDTVFTESICVNPDFLNIFEYDGSLGPSIQFVKNHSYPTGAISRTNRQNSFGKFCSGTLISENLFLTASHCCGSNLVGKYVAFNYQLKNQNQLETQRFYKIIQIVEHGYKKNIDYAILKLEGNPGIDFGYLKISDTEPIIDEMLTIIQHPSGRPKEIEAGFFVKNSGKWMSYSDLDTEPGSSGSGVINKNGKLIGVHTNGGCDENGGVNYGMNIKTISKYSDIISELIKNQQTTHNNGYK